MLELTDVEPDLSEIDDLLRLDSDSIAAHPSMGEPFLNRLMNAYRFRRHEMLQRADMWDAEIARITELRDAEQSEALARMDSIQQVFEGWARNERRSQSKRGVVESKLTKSWKFPNGNLKSRKKAATVTAVAGVDLPDLFTKITLPEPVVSLDRKAVIAALDNGDLEVVDGQLYWAAHVDPVTGELVGRKMLLGVKFTPETRSFTLDPAEVQA